MELCGFLPLAVTSGNAHADTNGVSTSWPARQWTEEPHLAMRLMAAGVPLRLLLDLAAPNGPDSEFIADTERAASR